MADAALAQVTGTSFARLESSRPFGASFGSISRSAERSTQFCARFESRNRRRERVHHCLVTYLSLPASLNVIEAGSQGRADFVFSKTGFAGRHLSHLQKKAAIERTRSSSYRGDERHPDESEKASKVVRGRYFEFPSNRREAPHHIEAMVCIADRGIKFCQANHVALYKIARRSNP
jgi:hypothetical protein